MEDESEFILHNYNYCIMTLFSIKENNKQLFLKLGLYLVVLLFCSLFASCSKDEDPYTQPELPPTIEIKPDPGMDLYGVVTNSMGDPVSNVVVSDGFSCVLTNAKGIYQMKKNPNADIVFYSTPSGYAINTAGAFLKAATFWSMISSSKERYDFTLQEMEEQENEFTLICIGDPQVTSSDEVSRFKTETINDLKAFIKTQNNPSYGLVLGDVTGDHLELSSSMRSVLGSTDMPFFTTIGNHDHNKAVTNDDIQAGKTFQTVFGPLNYSFNRGSVHFVCLDNILYKTQSDYAAGFTSEQIEWLKQDLSFVPKDKMVIVFYHIPVRNTTSIQNRDAMLNLLKGYKNVHLMAGHTHYQENCMITSPVSAYEHIHAATCGAWWKSTVNVDGTPNGYGVYHVKGTELTNWYYKAVNYSKDFQIRLHNGEGVFGGSHGYYSYNKSGNDIIANIWNADSEWKIEAYEDGSYAGDLVKLSTVIDAFAAGYHVGVLNRNPSNYGASGNGSNKHAYIHALKNRQAQHIEIRATDRFGNIYKQSEFITDLKTAEGY